jgi:hypothetical protein
VAGRDDEIRIRPGRIAAGHRGAKSPSSFVGEVMRAAKKAGHAGKGFGQVGTGKPRSTFGRGRRAALALSSRSPARRVVIMARVVRHRGRQFVAAPLARHVAYLKREGVTRNGEDARLFDAASNNADEKAFAERCAEDRHHFRFIVSPEDAAQMADVRAFTRSATSGRSWNGLQSTIGIPTTHTSMSSCGAKRMTGGISSSVVITSPKGFGSARPSGSRSNSPQEPRGSIGGE